jgi:Pathogenicity locus
MNQATQTETKAKTKKSKATCANECQRLEQIPNIGPAAAADLRFMGITEPQQLRSEDALAMYQKLCRLTKQRHDPCVLDTYMAAVDFMNGAAAAPWWDYTAQRKLKYGEL